MSETPFPLLFQTGRAIATESKMTMMQREIVDAIALPFEPLRVSPDHAKKITGMISSNKTSQPGRSN